MTIDKEKLKALAEQSALEPKWYAAGSHGLKTVSHLHDREFIAAASPATVMALLAEIERLERRNSNQQESIRQYQGHMEGGESILSLTNERDQLKAENEALRKDAERYRAIRDDIPHFDLGRSILDVQSAVEYDAAIDAVMAKESSHG